MSEEQRTYTKNEKQKQAILYAIQKDTLINRTKLMKYVFLIDLFAFNKFHETILDDNYWCLPNGPVPEYGMEYTDPNNTEIHQNEFQMEKVQDGKYYYYKFALKDGVNPSTAMSKIFKPVEMDLIDLTLRTIKSRTARYLSSYTHTFDLWKNHECYEQIAPNELTLTPDKMEELEQLLSTKIYANSVNPKRFTWWLLQVQSKYQNKNEDIKPTRLPVFIDAKTGDIIGEGLNDS